MPFVADETMELSILIWKVFKSFGKWSTK